MNQSQPLLGSSQFDVVIVGAGCAGISAAIGLAKAGFRAAVLEAAVYPGAENWSGCVYFCENLAHPDLLGPNGVEGLAYERRLVQRGTFLGNGQSLLGITYRNPATFRHCYTVLRPVFDHHLAVLAQKQGVVLLTETTAETLIREQGRVVGITTNRGPLYADLAFLAEGDASHLVTREGYEQLPAQQKQPKFLHGIKQLIDLPPEAIERNFGLKPGEGAACEIILRNAKLHGKSLHLNMGGFIYTNHSSLSIGLVLPADHLHDHFAGDPNLLIEWFENLPDLQPWFKNGTRGVFGAKLIRGGGSREIPRLVDDGLAIGGAASGVGVDFPYPNYTGPATRMGLELVRAVKRIRQSGGRFTAKELAQHYVAPLKATRYWQDVEFLRNWPGYVESTKVFFDKQVDLLLGSAYLWTRPDAAEKQKWENFIALVQSHTADGQMDDLKADQRQFQAAMPAPGVYSPPPLPLVVMDGCLNVLRDWFGKPRAGVPAGGEVNLHYSVGGDTTNQAVPSEAIANLFRRIRPGLAAAAHEVYLNDDTPLPQKLQAAVKKLMKQVHLGSLLSVSLRSSKYGAKLLALLRGKAAKVAPPDAQTQKLLAAATPQPDLTPLVPQAAQKWEDRLGGLGYQSEPASHIHLRWPVQLQTEGQVKDAGLWHVCPAHVYEARVSPLGQLQLVVNYENCIKCETCWRTSDLVDWGRDGLQRFVYAVHSPVVAKVLASQEEKPQRPPALPYQDDVWQARVEQLAAALERENVNGAYGSDAAQVIRMQTLAGTLASRLELFAAALASEPRTIDKSRADYLLMLARYALNVGQELREVIAGCGWSTSSFQSLKQAQGELGGLTSAALERLQKLVQQVESGRYAWAAAEGRHVAQHHVAGMQALLGALGKRWGRPTFAGGWDDLPLPPLLEGEFSLHELTAERDILRARLDEVWGPYLWRDLDNGATLTPPQEAALREVARQVPPLDAKRLSSPRRKLILAELARRDASLGYRVALHCLGRDLTAQFAAAWKCDADRWFSFIDFSAGRFENDELFGEALYFPAADDYLLLVGDQLCHFRAEELTEHLQPLGTLGLKGAGLRRLAVTGLPLPARRVTVDATEVRRFLDVVHQADLIALAAGLADLWTERCVAHANSRVQFPGLFHDEMSRDTIGKFGAVKKMLAEMAAARMVIDTLNHTLAPRDWSLATAARMSLCKAVVGQLLGTAPGSLGYNAGQVFGGTGYSEDDILSKAFRDSAAWRFLGGGNPAAFHHHGQSLQQPTLLPEYASRLATLRQRGGLTAFASQLEDLSQRISTHQPSSDEATEQRGTADAFLLTSQALLARLHERAEHGFDDQTEEALAHVWFQQLGRWTDEWFDKNEERGTGNRELESEEKRKNSTSTSSFPVPNSSLPSSALNLPGFTPETDYLRFLKSPQKPLPAGLAADDPAAKKKLTYNTGDFLVTPLDFRLPRYVPELIEIDATLKATDGRFHALVEQQFGPPRDGLRFERYIEREHMPDPADLDFCRTHGFFAMPIPQALGGQAKLKAEYYSLVMQLNQFADPTMSLLVQANTSIGTSPILLARDKDLPKAIKEIKPFVHDEATHSQIGLLADALAQRVQSGDVSGAQTTLKELEPKVEPLLKSSTLKPALQPFADAWKAVSRAVAVGDLKKAVGKAALLKAAWEQAVAASKELLAELELRLKACDLGLRWIANGQISAFALTEPSAGSDTARVATRARLCRVPVSDDPAGILRFTPEGSSEPRGLLDATRLDFRAEGVFYKLADGLPAQVRFDEYDYETDDPKKTRYLSAGGRKIPFTDVTYLRSENGQRFYDYWEMTGAKMWITNGRMSGIMALYAKTPLGVTGFIVDRHAEGLIVGKDEAKMGQNGSPTNELALQSVRVPRENVLGLEGRGQVNALETLNVGRAGLAMTCTSQMRTLPGLAPAQPKDWRARRVLEETFLCEALAYYVIGLFEHPSTASVRIESAVAKCLVSELLHSSIERTEELLGLPGQTRLHLVEKRKRDARIINLYEGTNEIQRFLIIKELTTEVLPHWQAATLAVTSDPLSQQITTAMNGLRDRLVKAGQLFGGGLWQNPNLQPTVFLLSEATMWLLAGYATAGRLVWLANREQSSDLSVGQAAFQRCLAEAGRRLKWFDAEWQGVVSGRYSPVVRAADRLFIEAAHPHVHERPLTSTIQKPLRVQIILEPTATNVPQPFVSGGKLLEAHWSLTPADDAALEQALRLRDAAPEQVTLTAVAVGPRALEGLLIRVAAHGIQTTLLHASHPANLEQRAAALTHHLRGHKFDLLLGPTLEADQVDGLLTPLAAAALGLPFAGLGHGLALRWTDREATLLLQGDEGPPRLRLIPAAVTLSTGLRLRPFTSEAYLRALAQPVTLEPWPSGITQSAGELRSNQTAKKAEAGEAVPTKLAAPAAATLLLDTLGLRAEAGTTAEVPLREQTASGPFEIEDAAALVIVSADREGRLMGSAQAALAAGRASGLAVTVLLFMPENDLARETAARQLAAAGADAIHVLSHSELGNGNELLARVLRECWPRFTTPPKLVAGQKWTELALPILRQQSESTGPLALRLKRLEVAGHELTVTAATAQGKLSEVQRLRLGQGTAWLAFTEDAEVAAPVPKPPTAAVPVYRWSGLLDRLFGQQDLSRLVEELKAAAGVARLADAEFILDVGYGVGNRDGYEAVIEPLEKALRQVGVTHVMIGGSRKVTEELHLLPLDRQIGQSGVSVNPKILLAIGISGAPQHLQYIGPRATILCFNKDAEAPMMTLNQRQPRPRVFPIVGDLFKTVPEFTQALLAAESGQAAIPARPLSTIT